jgi:hypothetical protein
MATDAFEEFVVGHGELWCAQLTAAKCRQLGASCAFMDARDVLVVRPTADGNSVDVEYEVRSGGGCLAVAGLWLWLCCQVVCGARGARAGVMGWWREGMAGCVRCGSEEWLG